MTANPTPRIPRPLALQLCLLAFVCLWPYALFQPWHLTLLATFVLTWRALLAWFDRPCPSLFVILPLSLLGLVLIIYAYGIPVGRLPGLSAICLLLPLKLLETKRTRDVRAALLLAMFIVVGMFLHEQSAVVTLAAALATIGTLSVAALAQRPQLSVRAALRQSLSLLALGVPLMLVLFVLFPRIEGPLWGLPLDAHARTGLGESMQPGSISDLIQSGEIAFRASFTGEPPGPRERYWRGPVLINFNGREWRSLNLIPDEQLPYAVAAKSGRSWDYTLTLEAHNMRWLLALDFPVLSEQGRVRPDYALFARERVRQRIRYGVKSNPDIAVGLDEDRLMLRTTLQLPRGFNPRTVAEGERLASEYPDAMQRVNAAVSWMRNARLQYTLSPPLSGEHSADDFLYVSKRGFCEHFASSFVILMRAAGVPARVVTGYQGGETNPVDGSLVVRQSDAHAWTEVWLSGRGWIRVDPTASSFPQRIDADGLLQSLPPEDAANIAFMTRTDLSWLRDLRYRWEAVGNAWNQWVLGYDTARQAELLKRLGLPKADWQMLTALMTSAASIWLAWIVWRHRARQPKRDALDRLWAKFCARLARAGLPRHSWEGPLDYTRRAAQRWPAQADTLQGITARYTQLRYGRSDTTTVNADDIAALRQLIQTFRP